jgi:hypothetical protein
MRKVRKYSDRKEWNDLPPSVFHKSILCQLRISCCHVCNVVTDYQYGHVVVNVLEDVMMIIMMLSARQRCLSWSSAIAILKMKLSVT